MKENIIFCYRMLYALLMPPSSIFLQYRGSQVQWRKAEYTEKVHSLQLHMQSMPITPNVVSLNPAHGEVY